MAMHDNAQAGRARPERPARAGAASFDDVTGVWRVPMSDSRLNLHSGRWSPAVQFRAVTDDGGESYTLRVREALRPSMVERLVSELSKLAVERGQFNPRYARDVIEDVLSKVERV